MNCRRVEKLIPLFVEGDLAKQLAERVVSHLDWCGRCNWLADDYKESQSWLRSSEAPVLDDSLLSGFKRSVLTQVGEIHSKPSLLSSLFHQWGRRQVLALSGVLMIVLGVFVFYVYHARIRISPAAPQIVEQKPNDAVQEPTGSTLAKDKKPAPGADLKWLHHGLRKRLHTASSRLSPAMAVEAIPAKSAAQRYAIAKQTTSPDRSGMLRIEIQTSDPSIRIIWFAPKETDTHQNKPVTD